MTTRRDPPHFRALLWNAAIAHGRHVYISEVGFIRQQTLRATREALDEAIDDYERAIMESVVATYKQAEGKK